MADIFALQREVSDIQRQQERLKGVMFRARTKYNDLERKKRLLQRRISKMIDRLERIVGYALPDKVARKIERQINDEHWMERIIERRFASEREHGPGSARWARLSRSTIARRGSAHPILQDTGVLKENAVQAVAGSFRFRGTKWSIGDVPVSYAEYIQRGTDKMPARRFFNNPSDRELKPVLARAGTLARAELRKIARS